jgi:hypothetical protein
VVDGEFFYTTADDLLERSSSCEVLLDNQATISIFHNKDLLYDVRRLSKPVSVYGIGGTVSCNQVGTFYPFGEVLYSPKATANVISLGKLSPDLFDVTFVHGSHFYVTFLETEESFVFDQAERGLHGGALFVYDAFWNKDHQEQIHITTVQQNESRFTKDEVKRAKLAQEMIHRLGYISTKDLCEMIKKGMMVNLSITAQDVVRARAIYGPTLGELKGKTVTRPSRDNVRVEGEHVVKTDVLFHCDVMFIDSVIFLVTVASPIGLTIVSHLSDRTGTSIMKALNSHVNHFQSKGFNIVQILSDNEGGLTAHAEALRAMGIPINCAGAGGHESVVERMIRVIKERCRAIIHVLPYLLPLSLTHYLVKFVVSRINVAPSKIRMDSISPREAFTGIKLDATRDVSVGFGAYCQVTEPKHAQWNSMAPRTVGALALHPAGNLQGSVYFYVLKTGKVVKRDHFVILPIPQEVVEFINAIDVTIGAAATVEGVVQQPHKNSR